LYPCAFLIREIIIFDFLQFNIDENKFDHTWRAGIHQMTAIAEPDIQEKPAPEGIDQENLDTAV